MGQKHFDRKLLFLMTSSKLQNHAVKESSFARRTLFWFGGILKSRNFDRVGGKGHDINS